MRQNPNLTEDQKRVMFEGGTESPFASDLLKNNEEGMYKCANCNNELFSSDTKFDSGTGWPSFDDIAHNDAVETREDKSYGMNRVEVLCKRCGAHLGHVFDDGPKDTTGKRYCINGTCLAFEKEK